jgi:DNA polymerase-3 subunit epsilon
MREVILDTETTGLFVRDGHRIVEIGCIELEDLVPTKNRFHCYLNPERKVSEKALEVHGYTDEFLSSKKKFKDMVDEFLSFIKEKKIIIHNASFDLGFLDGELDTIQKERINKHFVIDSLEVARSKFPGTSNSLDALCRKFNIDLSRRSKHNALLDCELLREVYINLLDAREPKFNLSNNTVDHNISTVKDYNKKIVEISEAEVKTHKEFLKSELKKNFY